MDLPLVLVGHGARNHRTCLSQGCYQVLEPQIGWLVVVGVLWFRSLSGHDSKVRMTMTARL